MDKLCEQYQETCNEIKRLEALKNELRVQLMACDGESTDRFTVTVKESTSDRVESLKAIRDKSESLFNALHEAGCIKAVVSSRLTVKEKK